MSLHLSKVRWNLSEYHLSQNALIRFFFYFLLFLPNVIDSKIESLSYWVGLERWTLNFLLLGFNAMCTPHDLINSDLLGKSQEPHFGHKGSDLVLFRRNYWLNFEVMREKWFLCKMCWKFRELVSGTRGSQVREDIGGKTKQTQWCHPKDPKTTTSQTNPN